MARRRPHPPTNLPEEVVADPDAFAACIDHLRRFDVLAFDTEFVGEHTYRPELCLVQVATPERMFVVDPYAVGRMEPFWELLLDPRRVSVVHAGREEVRQCRFAVGRPPASLVDVQIAAGLVGMTYPIGYAGLVQEVLGARAHKGDTLSDWRRRPLSASQVKYAFDDVRYLLPVWTVIGEQLRQLDRTAWAEEEFATFVRRAVADDPAVEKWRKVKGLGGLGRRELAVVRAVYQWRDEFAARVNRPPRVLLRDDLIVEIARRGAKRLDDLGSLRGIPRGESDAITSAVQKAAALPPDECPDPAERDSDPPHVATLATLLGVVLAEYCTRMQLAQSLVATVSDIKTLVRARQPGGSAPADSQLMAGWRGRAVRPYLESFLDGTHVLRITDPADANPLAVQQAPPTVPPEPTPSDGPGTA